MSGFLGLYTGLSAIRAAQVGLNTASHNVANANTPGYTRQRVTLASTAPFASPHGPIGTGVAVDEISRMRDAFLDQRARVTAAEFGWADTRAELLGRAEAMLAEPDHGISGELGALWDAFEDLAAGPADGGARQQVVAALDTLAGRVRTIAVGWAQLTSDTAKGLDDDVAETNDLLARIAVLNRQIPAALGRGQTPNDLLDERDLLLDRLAESLGATSSLQPDGTVTVRAGGVDLVTGVTAERLVVGTGFAIATAAGARVIVGGRIGGSQDFVAAALPAHRAALDAFAADLAGALNSQNAAGYWDDGAGGAPGGDLLDYDPAAGAASLQVNSGVAADARRIAAAAAAPVAPNDGRNAAVIAALRTQPVSGSSLGDRVVALVVTIAGDVAAARRSADGQEALRLAAGTARSSAHGVSLDEELVAMVTYQRALEAASRVMTAVDEALDVLINRTGIVGR